MKAIVLVPFFTQDYSGVPGNEIDIKDQNTFDDLVKAGYIRPTEEATAPDPKPRRK
jgi:hypothetical protein